MAVAQVVLVAAADRSSPAHADATEFGGDFGSVAQTTVMDTRNGTGGVPIGALGSGSSVAFPVLGVAGVPASGVSAVVVTLLAITPAGTGNLVAYPDGGTPPSLVNLTYGSGATVANTAIVAPSVGGSIRVRNSGSTIHVGASVQGYFTDIGEGGAAAGGFVPVEPTRLYASAGALLANTNAAVQVTGSADIPSDAVGAFVNITVSGATTGGNVYAWDSGATQPGTPVLVFGAGGSTAASATVPIGTAGQITIRSTQAVTVTVDVQGYVAGGTDEVVGSGSGLVLQTGRLYDSRVSPEVIVPAGDTRTVDVAVKLGLPGYAVAGAFVNLIAITPTGSGTLRAWPGGTTEPNVGGLAYSSGTTRANLQLLQPGLDGTVSVHNIGSTAVHIVLDLQGFFPAAGPRLGAPSEATTDTSTLSDRTSLKVNVGNGNAVLSTGDFSVQGTGLPSTMAHTYNYSSRAPGGMLPAGWNLSIGQDVALDLATGGGVLYRAGDGRFEYFAKDGTSWVPAPGVNAALTHPDASTYKLTFQGSDVINTYKLLGSVTGKAFLTTVADRNGNTITYGYDTSQRLTTVTDTQGRTMTVAYGTNGFVSTVTDNTSPTRSVSFGYTSGRVTSYTDGDAKTWTYTYDSAGVGVEQITDPLGKKTKLSWLAGTGTFYQPAQVGTLTRDNGGSKQTVTTFAYPDNNTSTVTDANNKTTTYTVDGRARVTKTVDATGVTRSRTWTANNNIASVSDDATSAVYQLNYDNSNNLTSIQAPTDGTTAGRAAALGYPTATGAQADYRPTSTTDPNGNPSTSYTYDAAGNQKTTTQPSAGGTVTNSYQGETGITCGGKPGQLCKSVDTRGKSTTYAYNAAGNLTGITPPAPVGATIIAPDTWSRPVTVTDGKGQATITTYDKLDRITQIRYAGAASCAPSAGTCITYAYDVDGNLRTRVDNTGTTTFTYDALNRPLSKAIPGIGTVSVTYDAVGNVAAYTDNGGTVTYGYDGANKITQLAQPGGSCSVGTTVPNATRCSLFTYDTSGRRNAVKIHTGAIQTFGYDASGRIKTTTTTKDGGGTVTSGTYTYSTGTGAGTTDTGLLQKKTEVVGTIPSTATTYGYDTVNRLLSASANNGSGVTAWTYTYDAAGNRTSSAKSGTASTYAKYNDANQLCFTATTSTGTCAAPPGGASGFTYDANGNMLTGAGYTFTYNPKNQTASIGSGGTTQNLTYADAASDELTDVGSTKLVNGLLGLSQYGVSGGANITRLPGSGQVFGTRTTGLFYNATDTIGTTKAVSGPGGTGIDASYDYDPYGASTSTGTNAGKNPFTFAGGLTFNQAGMQGLVKYGTRYYIPSVGVWGQSDPVAGEIGNPATLNLYAYSGGNPVTQSDPTGRDFGACAAAIFGTVFSFAGVVISSIGAVASAPTGVGFPLALLGFEVSAIGLAGSLGSLAVSC